MEDQHIVAPFQSGVGEFSLIQKRLDRLCKSFSLLFNSKKSSFRGSRVAEN